MYHYVDCKIPSVVNKGPHCFRVSFLAVYTLNATKHPHSMGIPFSSNLVVTG